MGITTLAQLLAIKYGYYTIYVFKDLDSNKYIMCTRLPNWQTSNINIGDEGFLNYKEVTAGECYYEPSTGVKQTYNYSNVYFINFINKQDIINNTDIIL